jgi:hypothetical protein
MIKSRTMRTQQSVQSDFWTDAYKCRSIATLNRHGRWHVYLEQVLQTNIVFASREHAIGWLTQCVDARNGKRLY